MKKKALMATALAVVIVIVLNVSMAFLPSKALLPDLSKHRVFGISEEGKAFLRNLSTPITLTVIRAGGNDATFEHFVERYAEQSDRISLEWMELADSATLLKPMGYAPSQLENFQYCVVVQSDSRSEIVDYGSLFYYQVNSPMLTSLGMKTLSVSEYQQYAEYFASNEQYADYLSALIRETDFCFRGEAIFSQMIEYVCARVIPQNYILSGHGETPFSGSVLEEICTLGGISYQVLDLTSVKAIPSDAATLLVLNPTSDYSSHEISIMQSYLKSGGQMVFVTNEANLAMPNLMALMASYGMSAQKGAVKEWIVSEKTDESKDASSDKTGEEQQGPQVPQKNPWNDDVEVLVNAEHAATYVLAEMADQLTPTIRGGNSIVLEDRVSLTPLFTTSENAFVGENTEQRGAHILAAASEMPDGARLVWFTGGDSFVIQSSEVSETTVPQIANVYGLYFSLLWADQDYESTLDLSQYSATVYSSDYLQATESDTLVFAIFSILLIPLSIIICGIVIRHRRKKRVV